MMLIKLSGSLHALKSTTTEEEKTKREKKQGCLVIHGIASRVFVTSNTVFTVKGTVPMSTLQSEIFGRQLTRISCTSEHIYGFAIGEVDLRSPASDPRIDSSSSQDDLEMRSETFSQDILELFQSTEGLCFVGCCAVMEENGTCIGEDFRLAKELGIKIVVCSSDTREALNSSLSYCQAYQHKKEDLLFVESEVTSNMFWPQHYNARDVAFPGCDCSQKINIVNSLHAHDANLVIAMLSGNAFSLPAMKVAHIGIAIASDKENNAPSSSQQQPQQIQVDKIPLSDFICNSADLVIRQEECLHLLLSYIQEVRLKTNNNNNNQQQEIQQQQQSLLLLN